MAELYQKSVKTINEQIQNIYNEKELTEKRGWDIGFQFLLLILLKIIY